MLKLEKLFLFPLIIVGCCTINQNRYNNQLSKNDAVVKDILNILEKDILDIRNRLPWPNSGESILIAVRESREELAIPFADVYFNTIFHNAGLDPDGFGNELGLTHSKIRLGWLDQYICDKFTCLEVPGNTIDVSCDEIEKSGESSYGEPFTVFELNYSNVYWITEHDSMIGFLLRIIVVRRNKLDESWKVYKLRGIEYKYYFWIDHEMNGIHDFKRKIFRYSPY